MRISHPIAFVLFVPLDVELEEARSESQDGHIWAPQKRYPVPVITSRDDAEKMFAQICAAAIKDENVARVMDAMLFAAKEIEREIPGVETEATAWYGGVEFSEV